MAKTVELNAKANLRETPSIDSRIVEVKASGTLLRLAGEPQVVGGKEWVAVATGATTQGQGTHTTLSQIVADRLGVPRGLLRETRSRV